MTLGEAAKLGISRVRKDDWAFARTHLELHVENGFYGPWGVLRCPESAKVFKDRSYEAQTVLLLGDLVTDTDWVEYQEPKAT